MTNNQLRNRLLETTFRLERVKIKRNNEVLGFFNGRWYLIGYRDELVKQFEYELEINAR